MRGYRCNFDGSYSNFYIEFNGSISLIGDKVHYPLPGRLFRHGQHFDFMLSWKSVIAAKIEMKRLVEIIIDEIQASKTLDEILFNSRSKHRDKFTCLHRPLKLYEE